MGIVITNPNTVDLTAPPTSIGTTTPVAVNSTIFTALPANNTSAFVASGSSLTGSNAQSLVNLSQTWNTTGTPTAIFANITDTASNAASLLLDLQIGGSRRFGIRKDGVIFGATTDACAYTGTITSGWGFGTSLAIRGFIGGSNAFHGIITTSSGYIGFSSTNNSLTSNNPDTTFFRDAANTLAQRNGVNTQISRLYKSFTDASNYTRSAWQFDANGVVLAGESAGTGDANIGFSFGIKGTGAFQLQQTDSTATGGNARGARAIDLQTSRSTATQVASGASSFVAGINSAATGATSFALGNNTFASNTNSFAIGSATTASGITSFASGSSSTASGITSFVTGFQNTASGQYSSCFGGNASSKGVEALQVLGSAILSAASNQLNKLVLGVATTNATPTVLRSNSSVAATTNQLVLQNNSALYVEGLVIANVTGAGDTSSWKITATIKRGANAASTALVGTPTVTMAHQNAGASTWAVAVTADTTNGCLAVTVTGQASTTIRWTCILFASEVAF